jgi:dihydroflavonol-4-reductase
MSIIITGSTGHVGYNVAKLLTKEEKNIILLVRNENHFTYDLKKRGCKAFKVNFEKVESFIEYLTDCQVLFHIAGFNSLKMNHDEIYKSVYQLSINLLQTALSCKVKTIIYTSSTVVLGKTKNKEELINEINFSKTNESD